MGTQILSRIASPPGLPARGRGRPWGRLLSRGPDLGYRGEGVMLGNRRGFSADTFNTLMQGISCSPRGKHALFYALQASLSEAGPQHSGRGNLWRVRRSASAGSNDPNKRKKKSSGGWGINNLFGGKTSPPNLLVNRDRKGELIHEHLVKAHSKGNSDGGITSVSVSDCLCLRLCL